LRGVGVEPAEADTAEHRSIKIRDTGQDNVLAWLSENGMVLSQVNAEGWCGVVCPNHAEHSDGMIEAATSRWIGRTAAITDTAKT
jgi:hypothetical protein